MSKKPKHEVHKYRVVMSGKRIIYRCFLIGCPHFIGAEHIEGRLCICNRCGNEFAIGRRMLYPRRIVKPHCEACTKATFNKKVGAVHKGRVLEDKKGSIELTDDFINDLLK